MDCPNGCVVPMKQIKVERIFYRENGEPIVIRNLTMNVCPECGQESMPLKSARIVEDILNGKVESIGQFTAAMYRAAVGK
ncbi:YgiT-type zinc finger protein [Candidatus Poribacteria bacterium]|nr:YgiT-type zinc finger protein [Candidatus Poribacteria bacterium]